MAELFASGRIVDLILVLVVLEAVVLVGWRLSRGRGPTAAMILANLASGACLMLAVRAALTAAHWSTVAAFLLASLAAHVTEMGLRYRDALSGSLGRRTVSANPGTSR